ncbi:dihydrolipoamide acetyltransferase component of pyruvate dehydrogenase complex [Glutamicibacter uratoxydans]|uniref:Dihydrolipoamide acetyltransferase component of pyruvate dehydrogenase complex n=1 Tax=Glutamicibacter uratoxydans TaxID=43667 RepID=A0A4Y4DJ88_GLUUR|nr:dihydrolipoamide acetyltransferase family protein [Glutamicibacter uratoxydans]GED05379.1 dihydrolipoamide acetyltransferase component of pyruvate dehydrogenase complex [Glutamicibacter uratoxydans]
MAIKTFLLPDLGEGLTEAELVRWMIAEGDAVAIDQPIAEVETAKSLVEIPSPFEGTVSTLHGEAGQMMLVDEPFFSVNTGGEDEPAAPAAEASEGALSYREEELAGTQVPAEEEEDEGSGNVLIGYGTSAAKKTSRRRRPRAGITTAAASSETSTQAVRVINPLVRKLARENNIDIHQVKGTGPDGLVLRGDVEALIGAAPAAAAAPVAAPAAPAAAAPAAAVEPAAVGGADKRTGLPVASSQVLSGVRKTIANAMSTSRREIPEATVWVDVDVTKLLKLRTKIKEAEGQAPSIMALISRFAVAGLQRFPELNSRIDVEADGSLRHTLFNGVNLGFAAQTDRGLVVPNVRDAHKLNAKELSAEFARLASVAREGKAGVTDLSGSTFTINNYGVFNVDGSAAIINYPEAAILGLGRIVEKPWVVNGKIKVRSICELTLSFDHRVCDGGTAAGFLRYVADAMTDPKSALASL